MENSKRHKWLILGEYLVSIGLIFTVLLGPWSLLAVGAGCITVGWNWSK